MTFNRKVLLGVSVAILAGLTAFISQKGPQSVPSQQWVTVGAMVSEDAYERGQRQFADQFGAPFHIRGSISIIQELLATPGSQSYTFYPVQAGTDSYNLAAIALDETGQMVGDQIWLAQAVGHRQISRETFKTMFTHFQSQHTGLPYGVVWGKTPLTEFLQSADIQGFQFTYGAGTNGSLHPFLVGTDANQHWATIGGGDGTAILDIGNPCPPTCGGHELLDYLLKPANANTWAE